MRSAGIIGWPVAQSKSPRIHRFWLEMLGLDGDYARFPVQPGQLGAALAALPALGLAGVNITVPHKVAALAHLHALDAIAAGVGAVNTVTVGADGRLSGTNTDVAGLIEPLAGQTFGHVVLLGAGGAARAVVAALPALGATRLTIMNRSPAPAQALLASTGLPGEVRPLSGTAPPADLLINATSLGMTGQPPLDVAIGGTPLVFDCVYAPLETPLLASARAQGCETIDGLAMLIGQAAAAFRLFYGADPPRQHDAALRDILISPAAARSP